MGFSGSGSSSSISGSSDAAINSPTNGQALVYSTSLAKWVNQTITGGPAATPTAVGTIQLTGDLSGSATSPTVPGLSTKAPLASPTFTGTVTVPNPVNSNDASTKGYVDSLIGSNAVVPGTVNLDSFSGASDDAKLTAAFSYIQSQANMPTLQLPNRNVTFSLTRTPFSGMRIVGASGAGPKNLELAAGAYVPAKVTLNTGSGNSSWMYGTGTLYDVYMSNIAFQYGSGASFWSQPSGNLYAAEFNSLSHFKATNVFGTPAQKSIFTQVAFTGHWEVENGADTQFHITGSDNDFWVNGYLNIQNPSNIDGAGKYLMSFDICQKSNVGSIYVTCTNGWRGVQVIGCTYGINFKGGRFEGASPSTEADGNVFRVSSGIVTIRDCWFGQAMNNPAATEHGIIEVTGGDVVISRPVYYPGSTAQTVPLVYASGGVVDLRNVGSQSGGVVYATQAGGSISTDSTVTLN